MDGAAGARFPPFREAASLCAYAVGCAALHGLLQQHYVVTCRSWLALFALDPGPYCALVRKGLHALQWSPVLAAALAFRLPLPALLA